MLLLFENSIRKDNRNEKKKINLNLSLRMFSTKIKLYDE